MKTFSDEDIMNRAVHLSKKSKADLDIDKHYTDSSDPCTLRKS